MSGINIGHGGSASKWRKKKNATPTPPSDNAASVDQVPVENPAPRPEPPAVSAVPASLPRARKPRSDARRRLGIESKKKKPTRRVAKPFAPKLPKRTSTRPSLSAQLGSIMANADALTKGIRKMGGLEDKEQPVVSVSSRNFVVGQATSKYPSMVEFFADRCTYVFHHPFEKKQINMVMYYNHMEQVKVSTARRELRFRIGHRLGEFMRDYKPDNPNHKLIIGFNSSVDTSLVATRVLPIIKRVAK